ncbi:metalloendopeptidase-like membrane protein [Mycobacterium sp. JS623]|uniref:M23 family metallopeptidase n=1 Tax=Mycobacterium sp. JS623 TaxID=212767 RepID=UPI0002A56B18|nr:M23 family metallopeptidase [Mycobacterium sp. JS623]AGB24076.1 metalloendopeptidase-like membrane protein [Mycobacterium sp. JS623]
MTIQNPEAILEAEAVRDRTTSSFIWPLGHTKVPDEMNTSFGPRIDADRWDFHDGIDLPAAVGTPVHAMASGIVYRAGPADKTGARGYGSTHVVLRVTDPNDNMKNLYLVYLHLDSIAEGIVAGAEIDQGDVIGRVGQEDATYPHLHVEFRKSRATQPNSRHPLHYLPYADSANFTNLRADRCNFYQHNGQKRAVRLRFDVTNRQEGDVQGIEVELQGSTGTGVAPRTLHVDFDDRNTIVSNKGDQHAFNSEGVAVEGYQKSNLKGESLHDLQYGVIIKDVAPTFKKARLKVLCSRGHESAYKELGLPELTSNEHAVHNAADFEDEAFPPPGWQRHVTAPNVSRRDAAAALNGRWGLLCQDLKSEPRDLLRAGLRFPLHARTSARPMSWRLAADIRVAELKMDADREIYPLAFLACEDIVAAACIRKVPTDAGDRFVAGVVIRGTDGFFRQRIDVVEGLLSENVLVRQELELVRIGTRQTTAILRSGSKVVARINGDTTTVEPDACSVGILHRHNGLEATLHFDQLLITEAPR